MASEGEETGSKGGGGPGRRPFRRLDGGAATAMPLSTVRLIREYKGRIGDQQPSPAATLPGRVAAAGTGGPGEAAGTHGWLLTGPGAGRRAARRRWLLVGGALALLAAAALSCWLLWLAGTR